MWHIISNSFNFSWVFSNCFNIHSYNFDDVSKNIYSSLLKIRVFWNNNYDVIISVHDVTNKVLSPDSNYITDVVMWSKFGNYSISMRKVIIFYKNLTRKIAFFEEWSWFRFNNFGLGLGRNLKLCISVPKGLKLKVRKFWGPNPTFVEVTGEKLVRGPFCHPPPSPSWIGLKKKM